MKRLSADSLFANRGEAGIRQWQPLHQLLDVMAGYETGEDGHTRPDPVMPVNGAGHPTWPSSVSMRRVSSFGSSALRNSGPPCEPLCLRAVPCSSKMGFHFP